MRVGWRVQGETSIGVFILIINVAIVVYFILCVVKVAVVNAIWSRQQRAGKDWEPEGFWAKWLYRVSKILTIFTP